MDKLQRFIAGLFALFTIAMTAFILFGPKPAMAGGPDKVYGGVICTDGVQIVPNMAAGYSTSASHVIGVAVANGKYVTIDITDSGWRGYEPFRLGTQVRIRNNSGIWKLVPPK